MHPANRIPAIKHLPAAILILAALVATSPGRHPDSRPTAGPNPPAVPANSLPLVFEPNRGQAPAAARYLAHAPGRTLLFTPAAVVFNIG